MKELRGQCCARGGLFMQGAGGGVRSAPHPHLQGPFLEGRNAWNPVSAELLWVRCLCWDHKQKCHLMTTVKSFWNTELRSMMWFAWVWAGCCFGCFCQVDWDLTEFSGVAEGPPGDADFLLSVLLPCHKTRNPAPECLVLKFIKVIYKIPATPPSIIVS